MGEIAQRPFVIAEISGNHLGDLNRAKELIRAAAQSGAQYVKFQHYRPETITVRGEGPELQAPAGSLWEGKSLWDLYRQAMTPWEWTDHLVDTALSEGIGWFSTPFDESAVDFLENYSPDFYKVASFELIDLPLIRRIASTGKPMFISTGMATESEISAAVGAAREAGAREVALLRTNSGYPAAISEMDLAAIPSMREMWNVPIGLSDHTLGETAAIVAVGLGAEFFEKHLTLSRSDGGPDAEFSAEPDEFERYVAKIGEAYESLGQVRFGPSHRESTSIALRPSLRATEQIRRGERISRSNVSSRRPSGGLSPDSLESIIGKIASRDISEGEAITHDVLSDDSK